MPAEKAYCRFVFRGAQLNQDGGDEDDLPDKAYWRGWIHLIPHVSRGNNLVPMHQNGEVIRADLPGGWETISLDPAYRMYLNEDGIAMSRGEEGIVVPAPGEWSPGQEWVYQVQFRNITVNDEPIKSPLPYFVRAEVDGVVDLTQVGRVLGTVGSGGTAIGPPGRGILSVKIRNGAFVFTYDDEAASEDEVALPGYEDLTESLIEARNAAQASEQNAAVSESNAADSATAAASSASASAASASESETARNAASDSAAAALASEQAASQSESNAADSAAAALNSEQAAAQSESNASVSETSAAGSASASADSATAAAGSATAASESASDASESAHAAGLSESAAEQSASNAATSESNAAGAATAASGSASAAASSAQSAETDALAASESEQNAEQSAIAAGESESNAASSASNATASESNAAQSAVDAANAADGVFTARDEAQTAATTAGEHRDAAETARTGSETAQAAAELAAQQAQEAADVGPANETTAGIVRLPGANPGELGGTSETPVVTGWDDKADAEHDHPATEISDSTEVGRSVLTASDAETARSAIGAGTSSLELGPGEDQAAAGNHGHEISEITDATATGQALVRAESGSDARQVIGAGTSSLQLGDTSSTAAPGDHTHEVDDLDDATNVGKNVLTAADAGTARSAIGLGSVDNTSDEDKPISAATAQALTDLAERPAFWDVPSLPETIPPEWRAQDKVWIEDENTIYVVRQL